MINKLTPILYVEEIEPALRFWTDLGFDKTTEVMEGDRLGFVILAQGTTEVMYQTRDSVLGDVPALADTPIASAFLYLHVDDLDAIIEKLGDAPVVVPRRQTDYGADEIFVREPGGNIVGFAAF